MWVGRVRDVLSRRSGEKSDKRCTILAVVVRTNVTDVADEAIGRKGGGRDATPG